MSNKNNKSKNDNQFEKRRDDNIDYKSSTNLSEIINNFGDADKANINYLEKSCQIMKIILNDNQRLKEEEMVLNI